MDRKIRLSFLCGIASFVFVASLYHNLYSDEISGGYLPQPLKSQSDSPQNTLINYAIQEQQQQQQEEQDTRQSTRLFSSVSDSEYSISTVSILLPAWEVLVIVSPATPPLLDSGIDDFNCVFVDNLVSPAKPAGILPFTDQKTFKCILPIRARRRSPFLQPLLTKSVNPPPPPRISPAPELLRWNFLVYESLSTENDVVLLVKGLNHRQGINREPSDFRCVFGDDAINAVKTAVTHSLQEVFRCPHPELTAVSQSDGNVDEDNQIKVPVSLEISNENRVVPSVAYYTPRTRTIVQNNDNDKSLLCACTMVYNVAKFLKEWVIYHSSIGVEKFILYDNDSEDNLKNVVEELLLQGYDVTTLFWLWPKTQEAGFSHCAMFAKQQYSCKWMMYIDVDEFVYSPSWNNSSANSNNNNNSSSSTSSSSTTTTTMLKSLLPINAPPYESKSSKSNTTTTTTTTTTNKKKKIGQVMIGCYEFGPSNQNSHPLMGVTQGYNCRRRSDNRHKSIVFLDAIDESLINAIHHFKLKEGYMNKKLRIEHAAVNHYKFQAWTEFKNKFRRRVSAYVADWTQAVNPMSKDRTPGLGFAAVEPKGWSHKFCEVYDNRLRELTQRWFRSELSSGHRMAWQR